MEPKLLSLELKALCDLVTACLSSLTSRLFPVDGLLCCSVHPAGAHPLPAEQGPSQPSALALRSLVSPWLSVKMPPPSGTLPGI